jgi:enoyl reductase-like protein
MDGLFVAMGGHHGLESYENHERPLTGLYSKLRAACAAISIIAISIG